jgi:asparagine synthase (glutamine-hydrolysing)
MCGICGVISHRPVDERETEQVARMSRALVHRGPDGEGSFRTDHVALAMRRLSIIDLAGGWQPLYNEDRSLALIANAEIYNFIELREALEARGHGFATGSDCEVILHLYEDHGPEALDHLRGMFAFALWDGRKGRLMLARDRMGEKPLYVHQGPGFLLFASEMKALARAMDHGLFLDPGAVDLYLHYQYVPEPLTAVNSVSKLDAAHAMTVSVEPWKVETWRYWDPRTLDPSSGNPEEEIREELEQISTITLRADVPVGIALSGGVDSGALAALYAGKYAGTLHAFTVGYPGRPPFDERSQATSLARSLGIEFHEAEITTREMVEFFPELVYRRDDPVADVSGHAYGAVARLASEHGVRVLLNGQGGDELFWGYPWVAESVRHSLNKAELRQRDRGPRDWRLWARLVGAVPRGWRDLACYFGGPDAQLVLWDRVPHFIHAEKQIPHLYSDQFRSLLPPYHAAGPFTIPRPWGNVPSQVVGVLCDTYLRGNGVVQGDRLSMSHSVELRLPFLDKGLVERVFRLRQCHDDYRLPPKAWLKGAFGEILSPEILSRPKRGFQPPTSEWYRSLFQTYGGLVNDGYLAGSGLFRPEGIRGVLRGMGSSGEQGRFAFKVLCLEIWARLYMGGQTSEEIRRLGMQGRATSPTP